MLRICDITKEPSHKVLSYAIDYKYPLKSRDRFEVRLNIEREGNVRLLFIQEICRIPDEKLIVRARVTGVVTKSGRPVSPGNIVELLGLK